MKVSLSGISGRGELGKVFRIYEDENFEFPLVVGFQVSNKSINYGEYNSGQVDASDFYDLMDDMEAYGFIPAIHYYTKDNVTIVSDLEKIVDRGVDPRFSLIQFNTLPPSLETLRSVKDMGFGVIFKVPVSNKQNEEGGYAVWKGEGVEDAESGGIEPLMEQVYERKDFVDYVMFDPSHGTNLKLELSEGSLALRFGKEIISKKEFKKLDVVYAGGINPKNVGGIVATLKKNFGDRFSIDAESGLRKDDRLDLELVREYFFKIRESLILPYNFYF